MSLLNLDFYGGTVGRVSPFSEDNCKVSEQCDLWGMVLNARKTITMIVSRSYTMHPLSPPLTIGGTVL